MKKRSESRGAPSRRDSSGGRVTRLDDKAVIKDDEVLPGFSVAVNDVFE